MITSIYQEVELSLTENLIPVIVPVKQYDNRARKRRCGRVQDDLRCDPYYGWKPPDAEQLPRFQAVQYGWHG